MSEHKGPRFALLALTTAVLVGALGYYFVSPSVSVASQATDQAKSEHKLESLTELDGKAPTNRKLDIQTWQTAEGSKVLFVEARELPMFDLSLTFAAGSSQDGNTPGIAALTNAMLNEGVAGKDVGTIAEGFDSLGAAFGNGAYRDMAITSLRSLSDADKRTPALNLFAEVVGKPTFPADSLARIKNQMLAGFEIQKQNPGTLASNELFSRLYGNHPYAHPSDGTAQSISAITLDQIKAFHSKTYSAGNAVIAIVGDLSREQAEAMASQVSAALPKGPAVAKIAAPVEPKAGATHIEFPSKQTQLLLAQLGVDRDAPDYPALLLGNKVLGGGGFGTRLMTEVREKRGLTYGVYSNFSPMEARGPFQINLQTRAELSEGTLKLVEGILADYLKNGPTQKELDDAKREFAGSFPLSTASNAAIVGQLGAIGFYDLPLDYLEKLREQSQNLTTEQVKAAMSKHLSADKMVVVTAGPTVPQQPLPPPTDKPSEQPLGVPEH
ncbi:peptidase M16 [Pseudomonas endophytica]|uniref:Peptidase M16 n=1 Tax=Pseudomonas endophytica TaxID=1563157 RepID=A0A0N8VS86_9PSED|nr:pitrilysin family protein [Pseudomonas endophytica]KQB52628.1 peptidase M16 [Pseudomonas endophytica]